MLNVYANNKVSYQPGCGLVVRWCWVNLQCRGVLLILILVGQGPTALTVGVGGGCLDIFTLVYHFSFLSPSLWQTARYRLKYCLKGPLSPKQPTNQSYQLKQPCSLISAVAFCKHVRTIRNVQERDQSNFKKFSTSFEDFISSVLSEDQKRGYFCACLTIVMLLLLMRTPT